METGSLFNLWGFMLLDDFFGKNTNLFKNIQKKKEIKYYSKWMEHKYGHDEYTEILLSYNSKHEITIKLKN